MVNLSKTHNLLIYLEDQGTQLISEISLFSRNELRGVLGKLEAGKLIKINKTDKTVSLTEKGRAELDRQLEFIHSVPESNTSYQIINFSVPESKRSYRDKIRRLIGQYGAVRISSGVWVGNRINISRLVDALKTSRLAEYTTIFNGNLAFGVIDFISNTQYMDYLELANKKLSNRTLSRLEIKQLIFQYALLLKTNPIASSDYMLKAHDTYKALRSRLS